MIDWKNSLEALRGSLPEGEDPATTEESTDTGADLKRPTLTVSRSTKGRAGKVATLITGFPGETDADLELVASTASDLRRHLGTGGSHRDTEILIQGECRDRVTARLQQLGFKVKRG